MVKINTKEMTSTNGIISPKLHPHQLTVIKEAPTFKIGESLICYIAEYDNNRFAVFSASGVQNTKYHVFESEDALHEYFEESV
jgi:hypothetical protein